MTHYKHSRPPDHLLPTMATANQSRLHGQPLKSSQYDFLGEEANKFVGPGLKSNPATSEKQARFMRMCEHDPGAAKGKCPSKAVATEFNHTA